MHTDGEESPLTELEDDVEAVISIKKKRQRRKKQIEPVVYDIPPVEGKETRFTGRLGYACLNTLLRAIKPDPVFCSRTCRLDTIKKNGIEFAKDLGLKNCTDLLQVIEWNEANKIRFFRVSSEIFPFASHKVHGYDLDYARKELKAAGDLARKYGHRLTTHPGQFTQLASPKDDVVAASVRELEYHCQMMRYMELDQDGVIIIHMGGVYGDKEGTLARFRENYRTRLTDEMKARLVLENDEICYDPDDLLPVCEELDIPMVLDYHHNWINPSVLPLPELCTRVTATWTRKGIRQKQHLSEPRPGAETVMEKRAHADRCAELPQVLIGGDVDLMIEAKDKEQAVFHLYRIYGLADVIHENLRPEKPPKPFVRGKAREAQAEVGDGEDAGELADIDGMPMARGKRGTAKARPEKNSALREEAKKEQKQPVKRSSQKRRRATNVVAGSADTTGALDIEISPPLVPVKEEPESSTRRKSRPKSPRKPKMPRKARGLVNQEEAPAPVDGASVEDVEADEHPEAVEGEMETVREEARQCHGDQED
ncbi:UV-endonuclease UvdE [Laetiporus sulphureus 93-53]|uniref:UV-endonuclease UvdE n=1 Tax=Laetiporus sulphureus 93-53 TaxID=1314785 RepID=A0A165EZV4_9APHY|nr:UV-endonuclease UvdE [Laetiporus sulphureus 93-53]KZT08073.1 UV-endonuclease UvdE [Laetiporus sulphureus 93-53]